MGTPKRIQRKRAKGWRMPEGAIYCGRPGRYGNPFIVGQTTFDGDHIYGPETAVDMFERVYELQLWEKYGLPSPSEIADELRGKDLVCWCGEDQPCHVDFYLRTANEGAE